MAGPWWVVAEGRGTSLTAFVLGPQSIQPTPGFAGSSFQIVGAQNGYPNKPVAEEAAGIYNAGGTLPNDPSQSAVDAAKATEPKGGKFSPTGITNRVQQAGGAVGTVPKIISNPLDALKGIADFFQRLTQASTWLRVAEVVLGLGLIAVGLAKITNTDTKLKAAGKTAVKAMAL